MFIFKWISYTLILAYLVKTFWKTVSLNRTLYKGCLGCFPWNAKDRFSDDSNHNLAQVDLKFSYKSWMRPWLEGCLGCFPWNAKDRVSDDSNHNLAQVDLKFSYESWTRPWLV